MDAVGPPTGRRRREEPPSFRPIFRLTSNQTSGGADIADIVGVAAVAAVAASRASPRSNRHRISRVGLPRSGFVQCPSQVAKCPSGNARTFREIVLETYRLLYRVADNGGRVEILTVFHARRFFPIKPG